MLIQAKSDPDHASLPDPYWMLPRNLLNTHYRSRHRYFRVATETPYPPLSMLQIRVY